ncbi:hypothetical protein D2E24_1309 [Bifidobacterium samirii]|uniref:Uncharacterized protein n=1 Tax=Bifidobacterium samirii TaxID=2306974 RepID=A0A430FRC0_9BIFI|nr:hypothetical protein D2E24_1309 [Bifidobacterium samirii]
MTIRTTPTVPYEHRAVRAGTRKQSIIGAEHGKRRISAEELDRMFDDGEDVLDFFDMAHPIIANPERAERTEQA